MIKMIVCDLDGTLCDHTPRMHLAAAGDWDAYHEGNTEDMPNEAVLWFLRRNSHFPIVFLTGRPDAYRARTEAWLQDKCLMSEGDDYLALLMRGKGDFGSDVDLKPGLLTKWLEDQAGCLDYMDSLPTEPQEFLMLEDRDKMVARWRDLGYNCFQVNEGAF